MEEILQSIKRIIAEEGEPTVSGGEVLELTEMVTDDGATVSSNVEIEPLASLSIDEIMASTDGKSDYVAPVETAPPAPPPVVERPVEPPPAPAAAPAIVEESLISKETLSVASAAMDRLREIPEEMRPLSVHQSMGFRSGTTVEDLVLESLKPMLREWLEGNLTEIVEHLVDREVRKLTAR